MTAGARSPRRRSLRIAGRVLTPFRSHTFVFAVALTLVLIIVNLVVDPSFGRWGGVPSTLGTLAPLALVSMASTPAIISGGIDLSLGPLMSVSNIMMVAVLLPHGLGSPWLSIPIIVALGAGVGAVNGILVTVMRFPPVIATLASLFVLLGVAYDLAPIPHDAGPNWTSSLTGMIGPIPGALIIIVVPFLLWVALRLVPLRATLYFVGDDDVTAFTAGVNVTATRIFAYALGGVIAALAGLALTGVVHSGDSSLGLEYTLIALAAVVLGGTRLGGGTGGMIGAFFGAASIYLIQNLIDAVNVDPTWLMVVYGGVLIAAAVLGGLLTRTAQAAGRAT